jgi:hypothetical protein
MTELVKHSTERSSDAAAYAVSLLHHYGFELDGYTIAQLLLAWQEQYPTAWIRLATIEALYQGRYKAISVEQILALWQRRSQPLYHFNHEFERLVCDNLPESLLLPDPAPQSDLAARSTPRLEAKLPYRSAALQLPNFEAAVPPESDVMLALRTLHSEEMAVWAESQKTAETDKQAALQSYSYKLGSGEQTTSSAQYSDKSTQSHAGAIQGEVDPVDSVHESLDVDQAEAIAETTQNSEADQDDELVESDSIISTADSSDSPQSCTTEPLSDDAVVTAPTSDVHRPTSQTESIARILQQLDDQALHAEKALPVLGLLTHTLKPKLQLHLTACYQPIWLTDLSSKEPIHQFTPDLEQSAFHNKLKAVAQPAEEPETEESATPPEA